MCGSMEDVSPACLGSGSLRSDSLPEQPRSRSRRGSHLAPRAAGLLFCCTVALQARCLQAAKDDQHKKGWGSLGALPPPDTEEYLKLLRTDYKFRIQPDYIHYSISMKIDPCRDALKTGGLGKSCCFDFNEPACQHYDSIKAHKNLQVAFFQNAQIPTCFGTVFERDPNCGTYIEIHRPGDNKVLHDVKIDGDGLLQSGFRTVLMPTHRLCLGEHQLWWVVRTRSGPYVQKMQDFFVEAPSCAAPPGGISAPSTEFKSKVV